ncbi:protein of unknown function (DUF4168) [Fodinibius salinus]|uniref:DUF4168 domain-containing protein n=2 Tax=Fodinibius salinus TaxID=860790 RepID=A0A5D3YKT3_9BACT|nr:protein of unknown function (DUF4168) [Fodinibius salinus]
MHEKEYNINCFTTLFYCEVSTQVSFILIFLTRFYIGSNNRYIFETVSKNFFNSNFTITYYMKFLKHSITFVLGFFLMAGAAVAQGQQMKGMQNNNNAQPDSISDKELKKFAAVMQARQQVQRESMKELQTMLKDKDMTMQRMQQIMMSKRNPKAPDSLKPTEKEQKVVEEIRPKMQEMQQKSRKKMMSAMQENDLNPQRFQAIMKAVQGNPDVMKRFQKIAKGSMGGNQQ